MTNPSSPLDGAQHGMSPLPLHIEIFARLDAANGNINAYGGVCALYDLARMSVRLAHIEAEVARVANMETIGRATSGGSPDVTPPTPSHTDSSAQPAPTKGTRRVIDAVFADLQERREAGIKKYGGELEAHNGRNALVDAYQEILDLAMYVKQELIERDSATAFGWTLIDERGVAGGLFKQRLLAEAAAVETPSRLVPLFLQPPALSASVPSRTATPEPEIDGVGIDYAKRSIRVIEQWLAWEDRPVLGAADTAAVNATIRSLRRIATAQKCRECEQPAHGSEDGGLCGTCVWLS